MQTVKISVIVPVYNVAEYLQDCVASILAQSVADIEVILVNDASADVSGDLCEQIASADPRVTVLHQPQNKGVSAARNRGIQVATGEYLFFADADDTMNADMFAFLLHLFEQNPTCDLAACGYYINEVPQQEKQATPLVWPRDIAIRAIFDYDFSVVKGVLWNKMFRRSVLVENNLQFDEKVHICEDLLFCLQYLLVSGGMAYHCVPHYRYIRRAGSAMHSRLTERRVSVLPTYQKMIDMIVPLGDASLLQLLRINSLNHHLHLLQVTWKIRDAETMVAARIIYDAFRPELAWFLKQKNVTWKRKVIAISFCLTSFCFPKRK